MRKVIIRDFNNKQEEGKRGLVKANLLFRIVAIKKTVFPSMSFKNRKYISKNRYRKYNKLNK